MEYAGLTLASAGRAAKITLNHHNRDVITQLHYLTDCTDNMCLAVQDDKSTFYDSDRMENRLVCPIATTSLCLGSDEWM